MKSVRRPVIALSTMLVLVVIQAVADPTGLLALVGWSGALPQLDALWTWAPYVVYLPVLLGVLWWVAVRAGDRFWTLAAGVVLAVMLAHAAACLVMTWDLATAAWAAGYVTAKAVPAALIVAAFTRWFGGRTERRKHEVKAVLLPALLFAAVAPLLAGLWWTGAVYAPGVPAARPDRGVALGDRGDGAPRRCHGALPCAGCARACPACSADGSRRSSPAAPWASSRRSSRSSWTASSGDLWPLMATYVAVADGLSFGACVGWIVGVSAVLADRIRSRPPGARRCSSPPASSPWSRSRSPLITPPSGAAAAASDDEAVPAAFLRADGGVIADGDGNQVLLRGVNVNQLVDFYRPRPDVDDTSPLTEEDFAGIAEQGFNVVRLGLSWSALEPERGALDEAYLAQIHEAVDLAKEHGLYVVLDMHQDSWWNVGDAGGHRVPSRHRPDVGLRRRAGVGDDHRRRAALPVPGSRHLAGERPRVPELLLRHRRRPGARSSRRGASSPRSSPTSPPSPASTC